MEFHKYKPIFEQIAEMVCKRIVDGTYAVGDRVPSVRELAAALSVNPNTVVAAYNLLAESEIIQTQRGVGYSTAASSKSGAKKYLENILVNEELTRVFKDLKRLGITEERIISIFRKTQP